MALNFPGPYELRIQYIVSVSGVPLSHEQRLNLDLVGSPAPGTLFPDIDVVLNGQPAIALDTYVDAWVALLQPFFHTSATITLAELWQYTPLSFEASYVSTYDISTAGTSTAAPEPAGQLIWSFRTIEGGTMKISLMEASRPAGVSRQYALMITEEQALSDFITGVGNGFLARDTSFPFAVVAIHPGRNEAVFRKRFRSA